MNTLGIGPSFRRMYLVRACPDHLLKAFRRSWQARIKSNRLLEDRLKDDQIRNGP